MNPAFHETAIQQNATNTFRKAWDKMSDDMKAEYGEEFLQKAIDVSRRLICSCLRTTSGALAACLA